MRVKTLLTIFTTLFLLNSSIAQSDFKSEDEIKEKAQELFEERKFVEASPLYAQLLSLYPQDANYNYRYAATLMSSSADREKPLKYLNFAVSKSGQVDPLAYYFLGKAYHLNYNFSDAVKYYNRFKQRADKSLIEEFQVERQIEMAKNGHQMLGSFNEVRVIEKQEISRKDFFRLYKLEGIDGKIIAKPEEFRSRYDQKIGERSVIYFPDNAKEVYFSSYGKKDDNGRDIYKAVKLGNNSWSDPIRLGPSINTEFDENYPFIHPDGRTLYFASKGHSSIGGYDLFMSVYDQSTAEWKEPVNLDFAFSSVDDDILFVTDDEKKLAYFTSNRTNEAGMVTVYKVMVNKAPANLSVIKGQFIAENDPNLKTARITVVDERSQQTVGIYETDEKGNYQIEIPENGGSYRFNVETADDAPLHTGVVNIPRQDDFEVLGQELRLVGSGNEQQLVIKNIFDGSAAGQYSGPSISSATLKMKANLDVNMSSEEIAAIEAADASDSGKESTSDPSSGSRSSELSTELAALESELGDKAEGLRVKSEKSYQKARDLKSQADEAFEEAGIDPNEPSSMSAANSDPEVEEAMELASKAAIATVFAQKVEAEAEKAEALQNAYQTKSVEIQEKIEASDYETAKFEINSIKAEADEIVDEDTYFKAYEDRLSSNIATEKEALEDSKGKMASLEADNNKLQNSIEELESKALEGDLSNEESKRLEDLKLDKNDLQFQLKKTESKLKQQQTELSALSLEKEEISELRQLSNDDYAEKEMSREEKDQLLSDLKKYRDNQQLAYIPQKSQTEDLNVPSDEFADSEGTSSTDVQNPNFRSVQSIMSDFESSLEDPGVQSSGQREEIYNEWMQTLDEQEELRREQLATAANETEQAKIADEINQLSRQKVAVRAQMQEKLASAVDTSSEPVEEETDEGSDENIIIGNDDISDLPDDVVEVDVSKVQSDSPFPTGLSSFDFDKQYKYNSNNAQEPLRAAKVSLYQAKKYDVSADEARRKAYTLPTPEERRRAFKDVNNFEKAAMMKELKAMKAFGNVNQQEFYRNSSILKNLNDYDEDEIESNNLDLALLLQDEADTYFIQAEEIRVEAAEDELSAISQKNKLQKAYDLEMLALSKQRQALESLKLVDAEVNEQAFNDEFSVKELREGNIQTITDPEVLAISNAGEAQSKGDKLVKEAAVLEESAERLSKSAEVLDVGPEKDSLLALVEKKQDSALKLRSKASVYYERKKQLEGGFIADGNFDVGILKPTTKYTESEFEFSDLNIKQERKEEVVNSKPYADFLIAAKTNHQQVRAADVEYQKAVELRKKQIELERESQVMLNSAADVKDPAEKQRRVNQAQVIDLNAQRLDKSIDSLNKIIKVKNYLVSTSEQEMKKSIAGLSRQEQSEIAYFASRQIDEEEAAKGMAFEDEDEDLPQNTEEENPQAEETADIVEPPIIDNTAQQTEEETPVEEQEVAIDSLPKEEIEDLEPTVDEPAQEEQSTEEAATVNPGQNDRRVVRNIDRVPSNIQKPIFLAFNPKESAYSNENPIPSMESLPNGIVYKVQVGAFRNPIPQDLFKGFAPLMAEAGPNGITRYSAGLFNNEADALNARDQIRNMGYSDAFVIAFKDGQRVSLNAIREEGTEGSSQGGTAAAPSLYQFEGDVRNAEGIQQLFFSVQIGVFSKEVEAGTFSDYRDLSAFKLPSGLIRYNAGIFEELDEAQAYKEQLSSAIPDAFVVAYFNGKRISISEAARIANQNQ